MNTSVDHDSTPVNPEQLLRPARRRLKVLPMLHGVLTIVTVALVFKLIIDVVEVRSSLRQYETIINDRSEDDTDTQDRLTRVEDEFRRAFVKDRERLTALEETAANLSQQIEARALTTALDSLALDLTAATTAITTAASDSEKKHSGQAAQIQRLIAEQKRLDDAVTQLAADIKNQSVPPPAAP